MTCRARLYARRLTRARLHVRALHVMRLTRTLRVSRVYDLHALPRPRPLPPPWSAWARRRRRRATSVRRVYTSAIRTTRHADEP